ncbi:MAG: pilus assembly protein [Candidatus Eremiobacteraeota bacterium]|nr:pilus assembly protein [Candidatus Eremiobacteraeota bacterium]
MKSRRRFERGSAMIELVIMLPTLLLMMIGVVEVGRFAHFSMMVHNAARAGVSYGAQNMVTATDTSGMQTAALNDGQNLSQLSATGSYYCKCSDGTSVSCTDGTACSGLRRIAYVQVVTSGTFSTLFNYPKIRSSLAISATAVMRVAQ